MATPTNSPPLPARPELVARAPLTFEGMGPADRKAALAQANADFAHVMGDLELMGALAELGERLAPMARHWDRVRIGVDFEGEALIQLRWDATADTHATDNWLEISLAADSTGILDEADAVDVDLDRAQADALWDACQPVLALGERARRAISRHADVLEVQGLTAAQLARPASLLFPAHAAGIRAYEQALDASARAGELETGLPAARAPGGKRRV